MEYLTVRILIPHFLQHTGRFGKLIFHGRMVVASIVHFLTE